VVLNRVSFGPIHLRRIACRRVRLGRIDPDAFDAERFSLRHLDFGRLRLELKSLIVSPGGLALVGHDVRRVDAARRLLGRHQPIDRGNGGIGNGQSGPEGTDFIATLLGLLFVHVEILRKRLTLW
jgi:hypothetical protein